MSAADEVIQSWSYHILAMIISVILVVTYGPKYGRKFYKYMYAYMLARFVKGYNKLMGKRKTKLFAPLNDMAAKRQEPISVLEIGAGAGANFKYLPENTRVICLDPNPAFKAFVLANADEFPHVRLNDFVVGYAEDMRDVEDNSVDAVVCTLVLCTVESIDLSVREIKRILKPVRLYLFIYFFSLCIYLFIYSFI